MRKAAGRSARALLTLAIAAALACLAPATASAFEARATIVNTAIAQLGKPYVWAAAGPDAFDCSGLVQYSYDAAGIYVPHQSGMLWARCDRITAEALEPGDLVFRAKLPAGATEPTSTDIYHVGIYVGAGQVIEAPNKDNPVRYTSLSTFPYYGRLRAPYWPLGDRTYDPPPVMHGDFDGDGRDDLAFFYSLGGTSACAYVVTSTPAPAGEPRKWWSNAGGWDWKCSKVVAGDFNGDGKSDLAVLYSYGTAPPRIWFMLSDGRSFRPTLAWSADAGAFTWARAKTVAADFDGDGRDDLGFFYDDGAGGSRFMVARSLGGTLASPARYWTSGPGRWDAKSSKVAAGDLTGDGKADLAVLRDLGGAASGLYVLESNGRRMTGGSPWYQTGPKGWDWNRVKMVAANVDGDGRDDVVMLYDYGSSTSRLWAFVSGGSGFSAVKVYWSSAPGGWESDRAKLGAADLDRDGRTEIVMLYNTVNAPVKAWSFPAKPDGTAAGLTVVWDSAGSVDWNLVR